MTHHFFGKYFSPATFKTQYWTWCFSRICYFYNVSFVFQCLTACKDSCPKLGPLTLCYPHLLSLDLWGWRHNKRFWDIEMGLRVFETKHMLGTVCTNLCLPHAQKGFFLDPKTPLEIRIKLPTFRLVEPPMPPPGNSITSVGRVWIFSGTAHYITFGTSKLQLLNSFLFKYLWSLTWHMFKWLLIDLMTQTFFL